MIGETLGSYRIVETLSEGGMGAVYVAEHTLIGRRAAVKVLLPRLSEDESIVQRFFNEARGTAKIGHPGIVEIFDFGYARDGRAYLIMEYLQGESLQGRLKREGKLPIDRSAALLQHIVHALGAAHAKGIVHRDLKPDNIFVVPDQAVEYGERTKILDFGIAKLADEQADGVKTRTGAVMGTPWYMAPEQCRGAGAVDERADLYALGCIFFKMLCGRPPFVGASGEVIGQHLYMPPPLPSSLEPSVHPQAEAIIMRLLDKEPARRPQSTAELDAELAGLRAVIGGGRRTPTMPPEPTPVPPPMPRPEFLPDTVRVRAATAPPAAEMPARAMHHPPSETVSARAGSSPPARAGSHALDYPFAQPHDGMAVASATTLRGTASERVPVMVPPQQRRWVPIAIACAGVLLLGGGILFGLSSSGSPPTEIAGAQPALSEADKQELAEPAGADSPGMAAQDGPTGPAMADLAMDNSTKNAEAPVAALSTAGEQADKPTENADVVAVPPAAAEAPQTVALTLESTPKAHVYLEDKRVGQTPYMHSVAMSDARLTFELRQDGYRTEQVTLTADRSTTSKVTLEKRITENAPVSASPTRKKPSSTVKSGTQKDKASPPNGSVSPNQTYNPFKSP